MKKLIVIIAISVFAVTGAFSQVNKFMAMYIYNFSRLVEWPEEYRSGNFVIGTIGNTSLNYEMEMFVRNKKTGNQEFYVKSFDDVSSISKCNILFVADSEKNNFDAILNKLYGTNTLIITEDKELINKGAVISFTLVEGKLKFYYNSENARKSGLKVSTSLENMALANSE
ncbi:MAG: YfiR family protein [Bacteroidota bacterium]